MLWPSSGDKIMDLYDDKFWAWLDECPVEHNATLHMVDMYGQRLAGVTFFKEDEDEDA